MPSNSGLCLTFLVVFMNWNNPDDEFFFLLSKKKQSLTQIYNLCTNPLA
jgi:hypothetical protein